MKRTLITLLTTCIIAVFACTSDAAKRTLGNLQLESFGKGGRGITVEQKVRNDHPAFVVRVDVDHPDHVYQNRELMKVNVLSEKSGYLYLFYIQADKSVVCLFPNKIQRNNRIQAHRITIVPAENTDDFNLRIRAPFGRETLVAIVSLNPLTPGHLGAKSLTDSHATPIDATSLLKAVNVELKPNPTEWAEHHVTITTRDTYQERPKKQRLGLFIGINKYSDQRIRNLHLCDRDAERLAEVMVEKGRLDAAILLTDEQATKAGIRKAFNDLVANSRPADEVFVFWSGHGGRCADDNGDERDGDKLDEYLVPHDAKIDSLSALRNSVLLDDTFGRWIQELDGRTVTVMIDACHAGGQATFGKELADVHDSFDFFAGEASRSKDIGQKDAAMLLSSQASETSKERRDDSLSVMTYYLVERLETSDRVTLKAAFEYLKPRVVNYVDQHFPGSAQTPVLSNSVGAVYLRP